MAAPAPLTAAQQGHLEALAPDLRFQLEQADVPAVLQTRLGELGVRNVALFSGLDETRDSVRAALIAELPLDPSAGVTERLNMDGSASCSLGGLQIAFAGVGKEQGGGEAGHTAALGTAQ